MTLLRLLHPAILLLLPVAGALMGWVSWMSGFPALFFVLSAFGLAWLWGASPSGWHAFLLFLGYFLGASVVIVPMTRAFFDASIVSGVFFWIAGATLLAAPFGLLHAPGRQPLRFATALLAASVPPLGFIGWTSPLLAAGALLPGTGLAGLALMLTLLSMTTLASRSLSTTVKLAFFPALAGAVFVATLASAHRPFDYRWFGQNTFMGKYPDDPSGHTSRQIALLQMARESIEAGAQVVLFPEAIAGEWTPSLAAVWSSVNALAQQRGATIILGVTIVESGKRMNSVVGIGREHFTLHARMPMPVSTWKPWAKDSYSMHLAAPSSVRIHDREVAFSICYEDMLTWPLAWSFATGKPEMIFSAGNNWFGNAAASRAQQVSIELQARLYGVPLIRATNYPES